ncbi:Maf family protein [Treponema socranskii]|uniref:Maf family protein n=1 Tax=Treponema socranskii TaxID=53419 RepID=UPI003D6FEDF5
MEPVILASSSPRRQDILKLLHIPYQVIMPNIDETVSSALPAEDVPEIFAREKVAAVVRSLAADREIPWVLAADTVIIFNNKIYGKPSDQEEAAAFLRELSGKTHTVKTVIALYSGKTKTTVVRESVTEVTFKEMSEREIEWYIETGEWHGAAGGYRIQSLASCFIKKIEGTTSGVEGLPISELYDILASQGYSIIE